MNNIVWFSLIILVLIGVLIKFVVENFKLKKRYLPVINLDKEIEQLSKTIQKNKTELSQLQDSYKEKYGIYTELLKNVDLLSDEVEMLEVGLYKPVFNFDTSEKFKEALKINYDKQKNMIKNEAAVICFTEWTSNGSRREVKKMTKQYIKLMLRAFNGECDAIIARVKWNNFNKMKERMEKAFIDINKCGSTHNTEIQRTYLKLKKEELHLTFEYEQKKYEEKEEQRRIREQIREEEKAQREFEQARLKAEKEEADYQKALKKAQEDLAKANNETRAKYEDKIKKLQEALQEAEERKQRAISQAQLTKSGHVYVISNIGSFGEDVYKIGMTRRLEPEDRVNELGDASVPFKFDIHAMISSDNAPALENKLHEIFKLRSVNRVNYKKEFFRVSLDEIEKAVKDYTNADITFTKIAEAKEYKETQAILLAETSKRKKTKEDKEVLPATL